MSQATFSHKSICILRLSSIGDITHMIPIIKSIQSYAPQTDITWIIGKTEYSLVKNISNVHFIVIDKKDFLSTFSTLIYLYKNFRFDALLNMQVSLRANIISLFIKAKIKIGFDKHNSKNLHGFFINTRINNSMRKHVRETFFEFLSKIGIEKISFLMIVGGSLGNLFDRIYYSSVPDFIDISVNNFHWFIFNVADIFITIGVILLIILEFFKKKT